MGKRGFIFKSLARISAAFVIVMCLVVAGISSVLAQSPSGDFSLQVTPSPLVTTVKPGEVTNLELKIRNGGTSTENLKIEPRKFTVNKQDGSIKFEDTVAPEIAPWIRFGAPTFTVKPGEWANETVRIALPKETGFSYSFALVITRVANPKPIEAGRLIKGSVAIFTLVNVDRPGATRKLEVTNFTSDQSVYEYLPAEFKVSFQNTGNTIVQPYGNIFIQRGSNDNSPISTLPVNDKGGYLLPDTPRDLTAQWDAGFPFIKTTKAADGSSRQELQVDWSKLSDFRIGPYTAKLVAIYNDGQRDVPIEKEITFWVFPWRTLLILTVIIAIIVYIRHKQIERKTRKAVKRALAERDKQGAKNDK